MRITHKKNGDCFSKYALLKCLMYIASLHQDCICRFGYKSLAGNNIMKIKKIYGLPGQE